jgi:DNA primase large subunit
MIINNKRKTAPRTSLGGEGAPVKIYSNCGISVYDQPPMETITLFDFEKIALHRLQTLRTIEFAYDQTKSHSDVLEEVNKFTLNHGLNVEGTATRQNNGAHKFNHTVSREQREENLKNDQIGHFICRLAYCRNEELRRWFSTYETKLFNLRLQAMEPVQIQDFLSDKCGVSYGKIKNTDEDWTKYKDFITFNAPGETAEKYVKVPFKEAINLVGRKQVFVRKAIAYVHIRELTTIASAHFKAKVYAELTKASKQIPIVFKDQRMRELLLNLSNINNIDFNLYEPKAHTGDDKISLQSLDSLANTSYPPCMKTLHKAVVQNAHLKHYGRLQLGLFLKGMGLSVEESLTFWKQKFSKKTDGEKFEKNYAYNVRHMYGREGKKNDYKPWNCTKVIGQVNPGQGEYHGCPFKNMDEAHLRQMVRSYGVGENEEREILNKQKEKHYQVACVKLWEAVHKGGVGDNVGNHPNAFITSSLEYNKEKKPAAAPAAKDGAQMEV